ncbi:serine-threonine kinase [Klebsiella phage Whistle]|uniref:Serine-threonine kinase n=1 Tax=Klebsiella phage Whistle TaxID=3018531 RepID=A0AAF0IEC8_9CAUD|nr:serine-threonine kinase [Klebsiella phage Whistle]
MNYTDMQARLDTIRNLSICELDKRQPLLVALIADIVNCETSDGDDTDSSWGLESQDYWQTLKIKAKDAGFNLLGNGHFSAAFQHDLLPGKVIKVGFKKEDSGAAYVAFCRMHQGRVGIPNVYHVARHAGCYTVVLDELEPCQRRENDEHDHYADLAYYFVEGDYEPEDQCEADQPFIQTCKEIRKFFHGIASFDMHSGNIMFTKDGKPVITDPVSFSQDREREPFSLEPEELLAEIEQIAHDKMIERCKRNKAKRDRDSTLCRDRRANNKARRNRAKAADRRRKARERVNAEVLKFNLAKIEEQVHAWMAHEGLAIQQGKPLPIDNYLQGRLMG